MSDFIGDTPEMRDETINEYLDNVRLVEPDIDERIEHIEQRFQEVFERGSDMKVRTPGRSEVLGNHTDYNAGNTLSIAINRSLLGAYSVREDGLFRVYSANIKDKHGNPMKEHITINPENMEKSEGDDKWANYIRGVIHEMGTRYGFDRIKGADIYLDSQIPLGAGFSSSAALELNITEALSQLSGIEMNTMDLAKVAQKAETGIFVGANTGFLDQATIAWGESGKVVYLDFLPGVHGEPIRSHSTFDLEIEQAGKSLVIIVDRDVTHNLADSGGGYNQRRKESGESTQLIQERLKELGITRQIKTLRDVKQAEFDRVIEAARDKGEVEVLDDRRLYLKNVLLRRAGHVISEMQRVRAAAAALLTGDIEVFGDMMVESGQSAIYGYEVGEGVPELEWIYETGLKLGGKVRNMGGGFSATALALIDTSNIDEFRVQMNAAYQEKFGSTREKHGEIIERKLDFIEIKPSPGIGIIARKAS